MSARLKLTLSYAGFLVLAGVLLLAAVWVFLLLYVPEGAIATSSGFVPNRGDLQRAFAPAASAVLLFLLVLGLVGGWFLAGRMLAPLARITDAARAVAGGTLSHRVRLTGRHDEFGELADTFDAMLQRLEGHLGEQQRFAANASHELRTPLAITQAIIDAADADPDRDVGRLLERLRAVNARAIESTEALLVLARSDQGGFDRERVDLSLLAEEAVETLLPFADRRGIAVDIDAESAYTRGSAALLSRLMANLVQNAIVHNLASGGSLRVATAEGDGEAVVVVENSSVLIPAETIWTLTEPFRRGDGRARDGERAGVGLGLALVQSIVRAHDGSLEIVPRPQGGLVVTVRLPLA